MLCDFIKEIRIKDSTKQSLKIQRKMQLLKKTTRQKQKLQASKLKRIKSKTKMLKIKKT